MEKDNLEKLMETAARLKHAKVRVQDAADQVVKAERHLDSCKRDELEVEQQFQTVLQSLSYGALAPMAALADLVDALPVKLDQEGRIRVLRRNGGLTRLTEVETAEMRDIVLMASPQLAGALLTAHQVLNKKV